MEEEIQALEETTLDWQNNDRLKALRYTVATLLFNDGILFYTGKKMKEDLAW